VPRGTGQDEAARTAVLVELGLDGVEDQRCLLILIDTDRTGPGDEGAGVGENRALGGRVVEVEDATRRVSRGNVTKQGGLTNRPRPLEQEYWVIGHPG
jgi:hypothetical protein